MKDIKNTPKWLSDLLILAGISITSYLLIELIKEIFSDSNCLKQENKPRVFISHSWTYDKEFNNLIKKFEQYGFEYYNHSVSKSKPIEARNRKELIKQIELKVKKCSKVVILAGMYVNSSDIIKEEIKIAKKLNKEIIAIKPHGSVRVPKIVRENSTKIIGNHTPSIINKLSLVKSKIDGK